MTYRDKILLIGMGFGMGFGIGMGLGVLGWDGMGWGGMGWDLVWAASIDKALEKRIKRTKKTSFFLI